MVINYGKVNSQKEHTNNEKVSVGTAKEYCENCCLDTFIDDMWVIPSQL